MGGTDRQNSADVTRRRLLQLGFSGLSVSALTGCSLFVMAGKMFFGDPKQKSQFRLSTVVYITQG
ncbi:MAG: hypothetical protein ACK6D4_19755, partial [Planctomyces sp.]